jgi:hypothetical protein
MKRLLFLTIALLVAFSVSLPVIRAEEDYNPIRPQMQVKFHFIVEHMEQKDRTWNLTVVKSSFPDSLTYTWVRPQKDNPDWKGTRILLDQKTSKNFNPWFKNDESKATTDTAPWISQLVLKELRDKGKSEDFREGGSGAVNWAAANLTVKDKIIVPVIINGKPEALYAFKLNKGITVWNNLQNPLILEYEPLGIPLFTSVTGWKVAEINY